MTGAGVAKVWCRTIDWRSIYFDPRVNCLRPDYRGRTVYVCWHEYLIAPIVLYGGARMLGLASEHGDGELIAKAMTHMGWDVARGSTSRGAVSALFQFLKDDSRNPSITPDGPRGPRRKFSVGAVFLASKIGIPICCAGYGFDRPWRARSWDRFAIPRPFSRGRVVVGPSLIVPPRLGRDQLEKFRQWFERLLNWLTQEAETWAESGRRRRGEMPTIPGRPSWRLMQPNYRSDLVFPADLRQEWFDLTGTDPLVPTRSLRIVA